jgi:hypothetical protein
VSSGANLQRFRRLPLRVRDRALTGDHRFESVGGSMVAWLQLLGKPYRSAGRSLAEIGFDAGLRVIGWLTEHVSARAEGPGRHDIVAG